MFVCNFFLNFLISITINETKNEFSLVIYDTTLNFRKKYTENWRDCFCLHFELKLLSVFFLNKINTKQQQYFIFIIKSQILSSLCSVTN